MNNQYRTPTYNSWRGMLDRCRTRTGYKSERYSARGINCCERWENFQLFFEDMGFRPDGMTLDRVDNSKPYSPSNCRWATIKEQARNRTSNVKVVLDGVEMLFSDACKKTGIKRLTARYRFKAGWPIEEVFIP